MTNDSSDGVRALGTLRAVGGTGVVRLEDVFDTDADDLWSALTEPNRLVRWLGKIDGELRVGGECSARFFASGWEGAIRVVACERPRHLLLQTSSPDQPDGAFEVTLTPQGERTLLVVEDRGVPLDQLSSYGAGDQVHLEDLAAHLLGHGSCDARERWQQLHPAWLRLEAELT